MRPEVIDGKQEKKFNRSFSIFDCCHLAFFENICSEASLNIQRHRVREKSLGLPHKRTSYADQKG